MHGIMFVNDEAVFGGVFKHSLSSLLVSSEYINRFLDRPDTVLTHQEANALKRLSKTYLDYSDLADSCELSKDGFNRLNKHSLVASWNVFESVLDDLLVALLINNKNSYQKLSALNMLSLNASQFPVEGIEGAIKIANKIKRNLFANNGFIHMYEILFSAYNIKVESTAEIRSILEEVKQIRNCIAHRGGMIDSKAVDNSPSLKQWKGKQIIVSENSYLNYHRTFGAYFEMMMSAFAKTLFISKENNHHSSR